MINCQTILNYFDNRSLYSLKDDFCKNLQLLIIRLFKR